MPVISALEVTAESEDLRILVGKFRRFNLRTAEGLREEARSGAEMLRGQIVANASGPPGPTVETGTYTTSFAVEEQTLFFANQWAVAVVTEEEYWRRLELGFVGVDVLGRHYTQPPFPHVGLAVETVGPKIARRIDSAVPEWWNRS